MWLNMSKSVEKWPCDIAIKWVMTKQTEESHFLKQPTFSKKGNQIGNETFEIIAKSHLLRIFNLQTADE